MSAKITIAYGLGLSLLTPIIAISASSAIHGNVSQLSYQPSPQVLAEQLGWVTSNGNFCGGYYLDQPFTGNPLSKAIQINSKQGVISQQGTSQLVGNVSLTRFGQKILADKAEIHRNPKTFEMTDALLIGNVKIFEPNTVILGDQSTYYFATGKKRFQNIHYRTALNGKQLANRPTVNEMKSVRIVNSRVAWGKAQQGKENQPHIYEFDTASFSTCPPINPAWQVNASSIVLNKNTGRGEAYNARLLVKNIPVLYMPYMNFSIDGQRKTGFLWPIVGASNKWGPSVATPYYFNIAPNLDDTFTPALLTKRGIQFSNSFRYLTELSQGEINLGILPYDKDFSTFKDTSRLKYANSADPVVNAELRHLLNANDTRQSLAWRHRTQFSPSWSAHIDINYVGDDYYLRDFGNNLTVITDNQLLQQADLTYKDPHWYFLTRLQAYQTLHPIDETTVLNQYKRLPQIVLDAEYPGQKYNLDYFLHSEITHFEYTKTPGIETAFPTGNRAHLQPGISWPFSNPYLTINPRLQFALTHYDLSNIGNSPTSHSIRRSVPIFDILSNLSLSQAIHLFNHDFQQTLEPQVYYTYIPYRSQQNIPLFDTTVNTLSYDQLFNYNRFTGIDRIGDANQVSVGVASRLIDSQTGFEKVRLGVGEIIYFANRRVTLCQDNSCTDNPDNHSNYQRLSPITGTLDYHMSTLWSSTANVLWNPVSKQVENSSISLHYQPESNKIINLGFSYVRNGDILSGIKINDSANNLKLSDISFAWPLSEQVSVVGRWSENLNHRHLQNFLYGLQYDTCCWEVRLVGGKAFTNYDTQHNNRPQYNSEIYLQFALKGLGNIQTGNADNLLASIAGYQPQLG